jgi:hypothetical protein
MIYFNIILQSYLKEKKGEKTFKILYDRLKRIYFCKYQQIFHDNSDSKP